MNVKPHKIPRPNNTIGTVTRLVVTVTHDNLIDEARFFVSMQNAECEELAVVLVDVDAALYAKWDAGAPDYKLTAHQICAEALGLELQ